MKTTYIRMMRARATTSITQFMEFMYSSDIILVLISSLTGLVAIHISENYVLHHFDHYFTV